MRTLYGYRLLVVDDSPSMCRLAQAILQDFVSEIRVCTQGQEALEHWVRWKPHVALVDYEMPALNGLLFAQALRRLEPETGHRSALLMVTAHASPMLVRQAAEAGYDGFIPKPLVAETVVAQIARLSRSRAHGLRPVQFLN